MLESIRYTKGLGNSALFARIMNGSLYWDFAARRWVEAEAETCRAYLSEVTDSSSTESWYQATVATPYGGPFPIEIFHGSDLVGNDITIPSTASASTPQGALTGKQIIDDALSLCTSPVPRGKALTWLNVVAARLAMERPWQFLSNGTATVTPIGNAIALPSDFGEFQYLKSGGFYFDSRKRLTEGEAFVADSSFASSSSPVGFTSDNDNIYLHGGTTSNPVTIGYAIAPGEITDDTTPTCWPFQCRAFFMRSILDFAYEYDMDERMAMSYQLDGAELSALKRWDNGQKPKTQPNRHGYRRTR